MKEFLKTFFKLLWNKNLVSFIFGALLSALGVSYNISVVEKFVCEFLPGVSECPVQTTNVVK